ncbi:RE1 [Symbiodinium necroappetens]|uniref:RE1 protein n=1 Tax=Symbiodinium necroappetens TaxID=1628268 RepID=A0A812XYH5_9DINO|nr:RE1 [Symbiodinium necroappetens]
MKCHRDVHNNGARSNWLLPLQQCDEGGGEAYIANLVRLHGLDTDVGAGLPCPKEWIQDDDQAFEEENYDSSELVMAQKVTGECLWMAYRTRPDILYVTNYMAAMTTKRPVKVYQIGLKVMSYLNATAGLKLKVEATAETEAAATTETKTTTATTETKTTTATTETKTTTATAETVETQVARHYAGFKVDLSGYSDASYAPHGGKSFGCSLVMIGKTPVTWKAGKQPIVSMSVELLEGSNCALLVQSTEAMLPATSTPSLYIDNQAASNLLNGSAGSWRTRHLPIRHAYVLDRVSSGELTVQHLAREDQPADLRTKLHSKARLLHLLGTWGIVGLAGLDEGKVLKCLKMGCRFLLLLVVQSLAVSAAKDPLPVTGTIELFVMLMLTCISAVALWEAGKALSSWAYPKVCGSKRSRRIRKLKELARIAPEAEIEKWIEEDEVPSSERGGTYSNEHVSKAEDHFPVAKSYYGIELGKPEYHNEAQGPDEHGRFKDEQSDRERVVQDTLGLMTVQHLRDGLAAEGLPVSGVKCDLVRRLGGQLGDEPPPVHLPTTRQLRYVLWIWRHLQLAGRTQILWINLATRTAASEWLARWKEMSRAAG